VVDVRTKGATPGDAGDDTAAIQSAVDQVAGGGGTVLVPDGVYWIDALRGVRLGSRMTFRMSSGAVLRAKSNSSQNYDVIRISDASNVNVVGGTIEGDLGRHQGTAGQWGHGLTVNSSSLIAIDGVTSKDAWGDGFYVGGAGSSKITLCRVAADHNRRQGISVTNVRTMVIKDSTFSRTVSEPGGAGSGIDLEPNGNEHLSDILVTGNRLTDNTVEGLSMGMSDDFLATSSISDVTVRGNTFDNNGLDGNPTRMRFGLLVTNTSGVVVEDNTITRSHGAGISVQYAKGTIVRGNKVSGTIKAGQYAEAGAGIHLERDTGTVVTGNILTGNAGPAISTYMSSSKVSGNTTS
jgi:parallel beta-helix repeat protein